MRELLAGSAGADLSGRDLSDLDLSDAKQTRFKSLHECFTRELAHGARQDTRMSLCRTPLPAALPDALAGMRLSRAASR